MIGTGRWTRVALTVWTALIMLFLFVPIAIICLYAFNPSNVQSWPLGGPLDEWFSSTWHNEEVRHALWLSIRAGFLATTIALLLGSMAAFAVHRFRFFGREADLVAVRAADRAAGDHHGDGAELVYHLLGLSFSLLTIVIGHATFCIVVVYNNVLARLRRTPTSLDRGIDGPGRRRLADVPLRDHAVIATALVAGGLLAFALSFDEVIVTIFTAGAQNTLPIWIFGNIRLGQQLPEVNVVVLLVLLLTVIPVAFAQRLTRDTGILRWSGESRVRRNGERGRKRQLWQLSRLTDVRLRVSFNT